VISVFEGVKVNSTFFCPDLYRRGEGKTTCLVDTGTADFFAFNEGSDDNVQCLPAIEAIQIKVVVAYHIDFAM
jgi:hypothetical protein